MNSYKQLHSYSFQILSVKMKVKFQCKMIIHHLTQPITSEVSPLNQNLFEFHQNITLPEDPHETCFILTLSLVTQKGNKYIAAEAYIYYSQLVKAEGGRLVVSLTKCIDPQAQMELKVNGVIFSKTQHQKTLVDFQRDHKFTEVNEKWNRKEQPESFKDMYSPRAGTRSQVYHQHFNPVKRAGDQLTYYKKKVQNQLNRSRSRSQVKNKVINRQLMEERVVSNFRQPQDPAFLSIRDKYKESYEKLKNRLKNESDKNRNDFEQKLALQSNEMLMKMKMKFSLASNQLEVTQQKLKNLQHSYQNQVAKMNNEMAKTKNQLECEKMRKLEEKQKVSKLQLQYNQMEMKAKLLEDKYDKEVKSLSFKVDEKERAISHQKDENSQLLQKLNRLTEKEHQFCHNYEHLNYENKGYHKMLEQLQGQVAEYKVKIRNLQQQNYELSHKNALMNQAKEQTGSNFKRIESQLIQVSSMYKNSSKELEKLENQVRQLQAQNKNLQSEVFEKDKDLSNTKKMMGEENKSLSDAKEKLLRAELDIQNSAKEFQRFKEYLFETINSSFADMERPTIQPSSPSGVKNLSSIDFQAVTGKKQQRNDEGIHNSELLNQIRNYSKQYKVWVNKLAEECKNLEKQNSNYKMIVDDLQTKLEEEVIRGQTNTNQLQQEIMTIKEEYGLTEEKYSEQITFLKLKIEEAETQLNNLTVVNEETVFNLNGVKMQKQTEISFLESNVTELKRKLMATDERVKILEESEESLQNMKHLLEIEKEKLQQMIKHLNEEGDKKDTQIKDLSKLIEQKNAEIEEGKLTKKKNTALILELEMMLNNEKEINMKNIELLTEEEKKGHNSKQFINDLIKQKETILKADLKKAQQIIEIESKIQSLNEEVSSLNENLQLKSQLLNQEKSTTKRQLQQIKQLEEEKQILEEKIKKQTEKSQDRERQLKLQKQLTESNQEKYEADLNTKLKQIKELKEFLEEKQTIIANTKKEHSEKYVQFYEQFEKKEKSLNLIQKQKESLIEQVQKLTIKFQQSDAELELLRNAANQWEKKANEIEKKYLQNEQQLNERQELFYAISGEKFSLQQKLQEKQYFFKEQILKINEEWQYKMESMCNEYDEKLLEVEKQREYHRGKCLENEEEIIKLNEKIKIFEIQENSERLLNQQKFKRLDEEKNNIIQNLKIQIERLQQQIRDSQEIEKRKSSEIESLQNAKMVHNDTINRLQNKIKEYERRIQTIQTNHYNEIQGHSKRQLLFRKYEESVGNCQWVIERQIRRQLQNFTQKTLSGLQTEKDKKILMETLRQMEKSVLKIIESKMTEVKLK